MWDKQNGPIVRSSVVLTPKAASEIALGNAGLENLNGILTFTNAAGVAASIGAAPITDPGASGAIPNTASGTCNLVTAGAETRTLAIPTSIGQRIVLNADTLVGNCVVTTASAFDNTPHTHITFSAAGQAVELVGVTIAGVKAWRLINLGAALS